MQGNLVEPIGDDPEFQLVNENNMLRRFGGELCTAIVYQNRCGVASE